MNKNVLTHNLKEPLGSLGSAKVTIDPGDGNLVVDGSISNEMELASGTLQYLEKNGLPTWSVNSDNGQSLFTIKAAGKGQPWLRMPWSANNAATEWDIHLNQAIPTAVIARSDGGNIRLDLTGMPISMAAAETGGGNIEVTLPEPNGNITMTAKSGAGNVTVHLPAGSEARIEATTGWGKLLLSPRFTKIEEHVFQSPGYLTAGKKVNLLLSSGAGNVAVEEIVP